MFIELIDLLRCPEDHEESWLVAAFTKMEGRFVREGKLGCPICSRSYPITGGTARFVESGNRAPRGHVSSDDAMRYAAMLGLLKPGAFVVMEGVDTPTATAVAELTDSRVVVMNAGLESGEAEHVGLVTAAARIPVATGAADGIFLTGDVSFDLREALRILKPGGRIVADAGVPVTPLFRELARDDHHVVAEASSGFVQLARSR